MRDEVPARSEGSRGADLPPPAATAPGQATRTLADRLAAVGIDDRADPVLAWQRLRKVEGRRATIIDLYQLAAASQGLTAHQLPREQRLRLARLAVSQMWPGFGITTGSDRPQEPIEVVDYDLVWPSSTESGRTASPTRCGPPRCGSSTLAQLPFPASLPNR